MTFRAVTYNVHKCRGLDGRVDVRRIAGVLAEIGADVAALQEVLEHQAEAIAGELGMAFAMGENRRHEGYAYGNALLVRGAIAERHNHDLTVDGREPRGVLHAAVRLPAQPPLEVFNLHLGTAFFERRHQARMLASAGMLDLPGPRLVMGDFNEWTRGLVSRLLGTELRAVDLGPYMRWRRTYPGVLPLLHLDHIYYDPALCLERVVRHWSRKTMVASDHLPLAADFVWGLPEKENGSK